MEETENTTTDVVELLVEETPKGEETKSNDEETVDYWKSRARQHEKQAKENKEAALAWTEYQESQKSVEEKRAEELAAIQSELDKERTERIRLEIATERGISGDALKLLDGSTREEIEAKADALLELIAAQSSNKSPRPDPSQGRVVTNGGSVADQFASAIESLL
jgi:hypothetical protein